MISSEPLAAALVLMQVPALADTVVTVQASPTGLQRWVELLTSISSIVIALALIAIAIPLIPAAWNSRKTYRNVNRMVDRLQRDLQPILRHAHEIADNLNYVSTSVRTDVQQFKGTIESTQAQLHRAAEVTEQRLSEFNALLKVVQEEAEDLFIGTASTVRGVRAGARALRRDGPGMGPAWEVEADEDEGPAGPPPPPHSHP